MREQTNKILKTLCIYMLVISMMLSNLVGSLDVMAAGIAPNPTITLAAAGSKEVKGGGLLGANRRKKQNITTTIYVTVKNGETVVEEANTVIESTNKAKEWVVKLQNELVAGYTVYVKQKCNTDISDEVSAVVKETSASKHKNSIQMPSGDFYLEQFSSNIISEDEKAEALQMIKDANPSFSDEIESIDFSIKGVEEAKKAYYIINYKDNSKSEEIEAPKLKIIKVTEHSRGFTLEPYDVVSTVIKGKLDGDGPFDNIKVQFSSKLSEAAKKNFCESGTCTIDKDSSNFQTIDVNPQTGEFSIDVGENTLELDKVIGIVVKEPHKFATCNSSVTEIAIPKVDVKDPKKLKPEEKKAIVDAIRKANTTASGISKLPDGTADKKGVPAVIQVDDSGNVKIFSGNDVAGTWDWDNGGIFVPETNEDGSYKLNDGAKSKTTLDKPEELVKNVAPDAPKLENKEGNVVITPNLEVDTDAKKVVVEYEGADGSKKTITATKTDTGWTVDNDKAKVDENGVVSIPTKEIKTGTKVTASVEDEGGLVPEEKALDSGKAELLIENKYKVTYDANGGSGTMAEEEVNTGSNYRISENKFTPPADKEFDHWMIGFEPKNPGETTEVNNDITIKAIWKYKINPTASEIDTTVGHPVSYQMYKDAIKDFPTALTVEHIEVKSAPDISKVGGTQATIEVRFSDGQFRTIPVTVNVKPDPKDKTIEDLNKKVEGLNKQITDLNNTITEKDNKITELNKNITDLETKLQECKNQCAADKAQCEKDKQALRDQIAELEKAKSNLEIQVKENRELIEQLRKEIAGLEKQVGDWKKIAGDKDTKIKELENNIKELNTKLETANNANTELKEKLAAANQKITDLEAKVKELEGKVTELEGKIVELVNTIKTKDTEIKTLNETITTLKEKVATLETEKTKDKEAYEKDKTALQEKLDKANQDLADKNTELDKIKAELEQAKKDLNDEKVKNAGLTEKTKAQEEKIADLEAQLKALQDKLNKADADLKVANDKIAKLEKELATKDADNKNLTAQVEKLGKDLETKTAEVKTLTDKVTELEKQVSEKTAKGEADAKEIERLNKELAELKKQLEGKNTEVENLNNQIVTLKETVKTLEGKNTELTNNVTRLENEVKKLKGKLETANNKILELTKENATLTERLKNKEEENAKLVADKTKLEEEKDKLAQEKDKLADNLKKSEEEKAKLQGEKEALEQQVAKLKEDLSKCPADQTEKVKELEKQIAEKENQIKEKEKDIAAKDVKITELSKALFNANSEIADLNEKLKKLESQPREKEYIKEYIYVRDNYTPSYNGDVSSLNLEIEALRRENRELKDKIAKLSQGQDCSLMAKERFVTIFSLKSMLYKTYLGDELMTQAEMMDLKGFIEPFISNNRTMLPLRYVALSLGLDVDWNHSTRTATFTNRDNSNALNPGKITINANTLEMKDQYGNNIAVDSKPMLKNGRFYISITNLTKAFGGTNGNLADGVRNTIEWDSQGRRVLVYKYSK